MLKLNICAAPACMHACNVDRITNHPFSARRFKSLCHRLHSVILLTVSVPGLLLAQEPDDRQPPSGVLSVEAITSSKFAYQGLLLESGIPVTGTPAMVFQYYSDAGCTIGVGGPISIPSVEVNDGVFSIELTSPFGNFDGRAFWLGLEVEGSDVGCQEILPVPYALSLRPGSKIEGVQTNWDALHVVNSATELQSYGIWGESQSPSGRGVYGYANATSGTNYGVVGHSNSTEGVGVYGYVGQSSGVIYGVYGISHSLEGAGVYARGLNEGADLILGGNANTGFGDDGRIYSDPTYPSSDIHLIANDGLRIDLDEDGDGEDADFEVRNADNALLLNVDESGDMTYGGPGIAAFPRPAYDSGWISIAAGFIDARSHDLGGNTDNYVVDLICRKTTGPGVHNSGVGGDATTVGTAGAWWTHLTTSSISLHRGTHDSDCSQVRARIWMYP